MRTSQERKGREIVSVHLGQSGAALGQVFWQLAAGEARIAKDGACSEESRNLHRMFARVGSGRITPRCIFADSSAGQLDSIRSGMLRELFDQRMFVEGDESKTSTNEGLSQQVFEAIRHQTEDCDHFEGFLLFGAVNGRTAHQLLSPLCEQLSDQYSRYITNFTIISSQKELTGDHSNNTVRSLACTLAYSDICFLFDNQVLRRVCRNIVKLQHIGYQQYNEIIGQALSAITTGLRMESQGGSSLQQLTEALTYYHPTMKFVTSALAPLLPRTMPDRWINVRQLSEQAFDNNHLLAECNPESGVSLARSVIYRGNVVPSEACYSLGRIHYNKKNRWAEEYQGSIRRWFSYQPMMQLDNGCLRREERSACLLLNHTSVRRLLSRIADHTTEDVKPTGNPSNHTDILNARQQLHQSIESYSQLEQH